MEGYSRDVPRSESSAPKASFAPPGSMPTRRELISHTAGSGPHCSPTPPSVPSSFLLQRTQQRGGLASFALALLALSVSGGCGIFSEKKTTLRLPGVYFHDSKDNSIYVEDGVFDPKEDVFKVHKLEIVNNASTPTRAQGDADRLRWDAFNQGVAAGANMAGQALGMYWYRPQAAQSPYQLPTPNGPISFGGSAGISTPPPGWVYVGVPGTMQPQPPTSQPGNQP